MKRETFLRLVTQLCVRQGATVKLNLEKFLVEIEHPTLPPLTIKYCARDVYSWNDGYSYYDHLDILILLANQGYLQNVSTNHH